MSVEGDLAVAETADGSAAAARTPSRTRIVVGLLALAIVDSALVTLTLPAVLSIAFGGAVGVPIAAAFAGMLVAAGALTIRLVTGRRGVLAGICSAIVAPLVYLVVQMRVGQVSLPPVQGAEAAPFVAGAAAALTAALFMPPWSARAVGAAGLLVLGGWIATPSIVGALEQQAEDQAATEAAFERSLRYWTRPVTSGLAGASIDQASPGEYISKVWLSTASGGAIEIQTVPPNPDSDRPEFACRLMVPGVGAFDETATMAQYDGVCSSPAPGRWELDGGGGIAQEFEGRLVILMPPREDYLEYFEADRFATDAELEAAAAELRLLSLDELRDLVQESPGGER